MKKINSPPPRENKGLLIIGFISVMLILALFTPMKTFSQYHFTGKISGEFNLTKTPIKPGIYIVKITYKTETYQAKLIVQ